MCPCPRPWKHCLCSVRDITVWVPAGLIFVFSDLTERVTPGSKPFSQQYPGKGQIRRKRCWYEFDGELGKFYVKIQVRKKGVSLIMDWLLISPTSKFMCWNPNPPIMWLVGGAFRTWLRRWSPPVWEVSNLIKDTPESSFVCSTLWGPSEKTAWQSKGLLLCIRSLIQWFNLKYVHVLLWY